MPPTPPPTSDPSGVNEVPRTGKERFLGAVGGVLDAGGGREAGSSPLEKAVQKHYDTRLDEARMHRRNATTYAGILTTSIDPQTGKPLTDEQRQQYQNWYNASWGAYEKIAGVNKETKGALAKGKVLLEHIIGTGQKHGGAAVPAGAPGGTPQPGASPDAAPNGAPKQMTPPPTAGDL